MPIQFFVGLLVMFTFALWQSLGGVPQFYLPLWKVGQAPPKTYAPSFISEDKNGVRRVRIPIGFDLLLSTVGLLGYFFFEKMHRPTTLGSVVGLFLCWWSFVLHEIFVWIKLKRVIYSGPVSGGTSPPMATAEDEIRKVVTTAGLSYQHQCDQCECLLEAFGRTPYDRPPAGQEAWRCTECGGSVDRYKRPVS